MIDLTDKNRFNRHIQWMIFITCICVYVSIPRLVFSVGEPQDEDGLTTQIRVTEYVQVGTETITLKDISDIKAPEFLKESIEKIEISRSPRPGSMKIMERSQIESVLRSCRFLPPDSEIRIPDKVYIRRDSQEISVDQIEEKLNAYLDRQLGGREFEVDQFRVSGLKPYPSGELDLDFYSSNISPAGGRVSLSVDVLVEGQKQDRFMVYGWINVYESLVCSAIDLDRGQMLDAGNCRIVRVNVSRLRGSYATTLEEVEGKVLKTNLKVGDYIRTDQFENRAVIQKGALVKLVAQKDNLLIVASGISKEDGVINQLIRVENLSSGKTVRGMVKDKTKVEVLY